MVFVSALLVINAGSRNTASVFIPGDAGIQPALQGMVFCLLAFVGFEAAAPLAEETRDPKRNTRLAIIGSAILIGLFYVFCYYAATVYFGPDKMADFFAANDSNPWGGMADEVLPGIGSYLVTIAILNSCLANANSGANASTRSVFALGRSRLLPAAFGTSTRRIARRRRRSTCRRSSGSSSPSGSASTWATSTRRRPAR